MPSLAGGFTVSNGDIATASYLNTWFGTGTLSFSSGKTLLGNSTLGATTFQEIPLSSNLSFSANSAGSALGIADSPTITGPTTISQATGGGPPSLTISGNGAGPIVETIKNTLAGASSYAQLRIFNDSSQGPILAVNSSAYSGSGFGGLASTGYLSMGGNYSFQIGANTLTFYSGSSLTQSLLIDASNAATFYGTATVTGLLTASGGITGSIGQTTAAAGSFTTLSASGTSTLTGNVGIGVGPQTNWGILIGNSGAGNSWVAYGNHTTWTPGANSQTTFGVYSIPVYATGTYIGLTTYGAFFNTPTVTGSGTIANAYQIYIAQCVAATSSYGIYQSGTDANVLGGSLSVAGNVIHGLSLSPTSSGTGTTGTITWDTSYIYVCTATNTWKRAALTGGY